MFLSVGYTGFGLVAFISPLRPPHADPNHYAGPASQASEMRRSNWQLGTVKITRFFVFAVVFALRLQYYMPGGCPAGAGCINLSICCCCAYVALIKFLFSVSFRCGVVANFDV